MKFVSVHRQYETGYLPSTLVVNNRVVDRPVILLVGGIAFKQKKRVVRGPIGLPFARVQSERRHWQVHRTTPTSTP